VKTANLSAASSSSGKEKSRQELNLAIMVGAEAITCCGWQESHE
jgi:hypothetical protein